jgi:hypothetical protein
LVLKSCPVPGTVDFTRNETYVPWRYYYRQIFGANSLIDVLGGTDVVPAEAANKLTMGQAKAMRAYGYFYLTQLYARSMVMGVQRFSLFIKPRMLHQLINQKVQRKMYMI